MTADVRPSREDGTIMRDPNPGSKRAATAANEHSAAG